MLQQLQAASNAGARSGARTGARSHRHARAGAVASGVQGRSTSKGHIAAATDATEEPPTKRRRVPSSRAAAGYSVEVATSGPPHQKEVSPPAARGTIPAKQSPDVPQPAARFDTRKSTTGAASSSEVPETASLVPDVEIIPAKRSRELGSMLLRVC